MCGYWSSNAKHLGFAFCIERFSNDRRKTKTKAITPTNHNRSRQRDEPIAIPSNYLARSAGKNDAYVVRLVLVLILIG